MSVLKSASVLKPLVLFHGWGAKPAIWQPLVEVLQQKCPELDIITPAWPGYDQTEPLEQPANLTELAEVMLSQLPKDAHWLGWSLGGNLALYLAEYLQRQLDQQKGQEKSADQNNLLNQGKQKAQLILLGCNASFAQRDQWPYALGTEVLEQFCQGFDQAPEKTLKRFHSLQMQGEPDLRACKRAFSGLMAMNNPENSLPADHATLAAGLAWLGELDQRSVSSAISERMHWLLGENDPLVPVGVVEQLPGQVSVLGDCGHLAMLTATEQLAEQILRIIGQD